MYRGYDGGCLLLIIINHFLRFYLSSIYVENHSTLLCDIIMIMSAKKKLSQMDGLPLSGTVRERHLVTNRLFYGLTKWTKLKRTGKDPR